MGLIIADQVARISLMDVVPRVGLFKLNHRRENRCHSKSTGQRHEHPCPPGDPNRGNLDASILQLSSPPFRVRMFHFGQARVDLGQLWIFLRLGQRTVERFSFPLVLEVLRPALDVGLRHSRSLAGGDRGFC